MKKKVLKKKPRRKSSSKLQKKERLNTSRSSIAPQKILVPIDFSEHSKKALLYASQYASHFQAQLTVLYVVEPTIYPSDFAIGQFTFPNIENELRLKAESELEILVNSIASKDFSISSVVKDGIPFVEVTTYATEEHFDLIILSTHGHTGVEHILFGSTAEKIIRKASCPVLVLRAEEEDVSDERV